MATEQQINIINAQTQDLSKQYTTIATGQAANIQQNVAKDFTNKANVEVKLAEDSISKINSQNQGLTSPTASAVILTDIFIKKHRNGPTGQVELYFDRERQRFKSLDKRQSTTHVPFE